MLAMSGFVKEDSIVRRIWGSSDTVLFIFAGASAEFALNKAVDWLYFTGKLPADPLGRLFSTVGYAQKIVFAVEQNRGHIIPDWAYRDVLFMLIFYSIASYELLERKLSAEEKEEVYNVFYRLGTGMGLKGLPLTYTTWLPDREAHLRSDLQQSRYTTDLFKQYKKHLGKVRYKLLIEAQKLLLPATVKEMLQFHRIHWLAPAIPLYKFSRLIRLDGLVKEIVLPGKYKREIRGLEVG